MGELFDDEWIASFADALADLPARPGASAVVSTVVTGGPAGRRAERQWHYELVDGRVVSAAAGAPAPGDGERVLVLTQPWDDALADLRGDVPLDEAFMRGTTKLVGSVGVLMDLLAVLRSDEWRAARKPLAG